MDALEAFAQKRLAPEAARLDTDADFLKAVWDEFTSCGLHRFEGRGVFEGAGVLAEFSGAFAFLALQQQVAGSPDNPAGVAFGHLRNPDAPVPVWESGRVSGIVPWLTGAGLFERVLLGFRREDGSEVRAWIDSRNRAAFRHSAPLPLTALVSTQTVRVTITELSIPESDFVSCEPLGTMAKNEALGALGQTPLLLGNCRASTRLIAVSGRGDADKACSWLATREKEIAAARESNDPYEGRRLRAVLGEGAVRLARLAALASGGAAALVGHPAERLYREALVFNLMAQTDLIVADAFAESFPP